MNLSIYYTIVCHIGLWQSIKNFVLNYNTSKQISEKISINVVAMIYAFCMICLCHVGFYETMIYNSIGYYMMDNMRIFYSLTQFKSVLVELMYLFHHILSIYIFCIALKNKNDDNFVNIFENTIMLVEFGNIIVFGSYHVFHSNITPITKFCVQIFETIAYILIRPIGLAFAFKPIFEVYTELCYPFTLLYLLSCFWTYQMILQSIKVCKILNTVYQNE